MAEEDTMTESKSESKLNQFSPPDIPGIVTSDMMILDDYLLVPNSSHQYGDILDIQNDHDHDSRLLTVKFRACKWYPHHVDLPARLASFFASPTSDTRHTNSAAATAAVLSLCSNFFMNDKSSASILSVSKHMYVKLAISGWCVHYRKRLALFRGTALAMRHVGLPFSLTDAGFEQEIMSRLQTPFDVEGVQLGHQLSNATNVQAGLLEYTGSEYLGWNPATASDLHQNWLFLVKKCPWIVSIKEFYHGSTDCHSVHHTYDYNTIQICLEQENSYDMGVCGCSEYPFFHYKSPFECSIFVGYMPTSMPADHDNANEPEEHNL